MNCAQCPECTEALSARLDGEQSPKEGRAIDAHLASCAACHRYHNQAAHVTRLARTAVAIQEPDVSEAVLAAVPRSHGPRLITVLRVFLGLVGLGQVELALVELLAAHSTGAGSGKIVLQGASVAHFAHESAAWNLALGVGFLWVARRASPSAGMVPTLVTFVAVLTVLVAMDAVAGRVDLTRVLSHGLVVLGLILMILLERLPRPAGGTNPATPAALQTWLNPSSSQPGSPIDAERPPDPPPSAQHTDTAAAAHRTG